MTRAISPSEKATWLCERARTIGFDLCGVAPVALENSEAVAADTSALPAATPRGIFPELAHLPEWLDRGYAAEMNYLRDARRADPSLVLDGARSLIVVALNYNPAQQRSTTQDACSQAKRDGPGTQEIFGDDELGGDRNHSPHGWISRYAWGDDYHSVLREKLETLLSAMRAEFPEPFEARAYVDTGPVIERVAAKYAGLGWLAKNTCLINQQLGSWLFLGVIITTLALEPSLAPGEPPAPDLCGTCTRCLDACPTQAFPEPYVLDSRRCISYLTIELRGAIPEEFREPMGSAVIGCDICQDVCPWNRKAPVTRLAAFAPREIGHASNGRDALEQDSLPLDGATDSPIPKGRAKPLPHADSHDPFVAGEHAVRERFSGSLFAPELEWLASLSQTEFSEIFRNSAVKRAKWRGLVRNACVALGNSRGAGDPESDARINRLLERLASSDDALISEHARWALAQLHASRREATEDSDHGSIRA